MPFSNLFRVRTHPIWVPAALTALVLAVSACATNPQVVREAVPEALLVPCSPDYEDYSTNGALAESILSLKRAIQGCNDDKQAIREWGASQQPAQKR